MYHYSILDCVLSSVLLQRGLAGLFYFPQQGLPYGLTSGHTPDGRGSPCSVSKGWYWCFPFSFSWNFSCDRPAPTQPCILGVLGEVFHLLVYRSPEHEAPIWTKKTAVYHPDMLDFELCLKIQVLLLFRSGKAYRSGDDCP